MKAEINDNPTSESRVALGDGAADVKEAAIERSALVFIIFLPFEVSHFDERRKSETCRNVFPPNSV